MGPDLRGAIRRNDSRLFSLPPTIVIAQYYLSRTSSRPFRGYPPFLLFFFLEYLVHIYIYIYTQLFDLQRRG